MEIKVISRETIKPSVPTPSHLRTFNLSLLDQICVSWYTPIIFFYQKPAITSQQGKSVTTRLKTSLSEALSRFYPLAGRIKDDVSIDCNDEGALFTQAQVNCDLSQFLEQPNLDLLHLFLDPSLDLWNVLVPTSAVQVAVQVGIFACGGISLSICFLHRIADAVTFRSFLMYWAAISAAPAAGSAAANAIDQYPDFSVASKLFPPKDSLPNDLKPLIQHIWKFKLGKSVRRRFVFDAKAISALKLEVVSTSKLTKPPSDVLVVSGLIWKHAMAAASELDGSRKHSNSTLAFPVNLRPRMVQPLSPNSTGNLIFLGVARKNSNDTTTTTNDHQLLQSMVVLQREAVSKINGNFITSLQGERGIEELHRFKQEIIEVYNKKEEGGAADIEAYAYSSWCKLGFYELDFGWGKPLWLSSIFGPENSPAYLNFFYMMDNVSGDGIEANLVLGEAEMSILERDQEFLKFASLNPSIII